MFTGLGFEGFRVQGLGFEGLELKVFADLGFSGLGLVFRV